MIYWDFGAYGGCADWGALNDVFVAGRAGRAVWSGMSGLDGGSYDRAKIFARIEYARTHGAQGTTIFDSAYLPGHWSDFSAPGAPYELPAPAQ